MSIARRLMVDRLALLGKVVFPGPLGFGDAGVPLVLVVLAFELTEFIAQAGGFVAILLRWASPSSPSMRARRSEMRARRSACRMAASSTGALADSHTSSPRSSSSSQKA